MDPEIELLDFFISNCRKVQSAKGGRRRLELVVPAAQWEMKFVARREEIKKENENKEVGK